MKRSLDIHFLTFMFSIATGIIGIILIDNIKISIGLMFLFTSFKYFMPQEVD